MGVLAGVIFSLFLVSGCSPEVQKSPPPTPGKTTNDNRTVRGSSSTPRNKPTASHATNDTAQRDHLKKTDNPGGRNGWPMFRGNRRRTGAADVSGPREANLKWVFRTGGRIFADAAITTDGNTIYVASFDHHVYAIDTDGLKKWAFDTGGKIWTSPAVSRDGHIYVGSDSDALFSLSPDGKMLWKFVTTEPALKGEPPPEAGRFDVDTSPLLLNDGTIVFGCHLKLIALRPAAGDLRWAFTAGTNRAKVFSSPAQSLDGTLFFGTQGDYFFALNPMAEVLWTEKTGGDNDSTPVVDIDGNVYFGSDDGIIRSIGPGNANRWETKVNGAIRAPLGLSGNGTLLAATYGRAPFVVALDAETGNEKWRFHIEAGIGDFYGIQSGITTDAEGYAYFGGRDGYVYCLNPMGKLVWKYKTDDQVDAGPVLGPDGTLYIGSDDGRLYAFAR